jgi:histidinol-phosphate aminotransferase
MQSIIQDIIITREKVYLAMKALGINVQPSSANFLYVHEPNKDLYGLLLQRSILIRKYDQGYYRMSIGTQKEMTKVIQTLKEIYHD